MFGKSLHLWFPGQLYLAQVGTSSALGCKEDLGSPSCQGRQSPSVFVPDVSQFSALVGLCARSGSLGPTSGPCELSQGPSTSLRSGKQVVLHWSLSCSFHNFCPTPPAHPALYFQWLPVSGYTLGFAVGSQSMRHLRESLPVFPHVLSTTLTL